MGTILRKVALQGIRFFAYHGFYDEEQRTGCEFYIDVEVELPENGEESDDLADTVNYEQLYQVVSDEMQRPRRLIETVAQGILKNIRQQFVVVDSARVSIRKMHPPLKGEVRNSLVELKFEK